MPNNSQLKTTKTPATPACRPAGRIEYKRTLTKAEEEALKQRGGPVLKYQLAKMLEDERGVSVAEECIELNEVEFRILLAYLQIFHNDGGSSTPVEGFISNLWRHHEQAMTPDDIQEYLDEAKESFRIQVKDAKHFISQYPSFFETEKGSAHAKSEAA
jgi:hypothetical protein